MSIVAQMRCEHCGGYVTTGWKFGIGRTASCQDCGRDTDDEAEDEDEEPTEDGA